MKKYKIIITLIIVIICLYIIYNTDFANSKNDIEVKNTLNKSILESELSFNKILGELEQDIPWLPLGVSDDGIIYGYTGRNENSKYNLLAYNMDTSTSNIIHEVENVLRPVLLKENNKYIVWIEGVYQYEKQGTRIKLCDKSTNEIVTIFESDSFLSLDSSPLSLGNDFILWVDYEYKDNMMYPLIRKYTISTGETSVFKENATSPVILNNCIAYITEDIYNHNSSAVCIENIETNEVRQITNNKKVLYIEGDNESLVVSSVDYDKKYYLDVYTKNKLITIQANNDYSYDFPKISERFISWQELDKIQFYDRKNEQVINIGDHSNITTCNISDNYIIYTTPELSLETQKEYAAIHGMVLSNIHIVK